MSRTGPLGRASSTTWRYALLGGLLALPFTAASYAQTGSELSLSAVLGGGFVAGFIAARRTGDSTGVGVRAGLVGALPALWMLFDLLTTVSQLPNPPWFSMLLVGIALVATGIAFALAGLGGELGARVGSWAGRSLGSPASR